MYKCSANTYYSLQGLTIKSLKHHVALQPLFAIIGAGMVFVGAYVFRSVRITWTLYRAFFLMLRKFSKKDFYCNLQFNCEHFLFVYIVKQIKSSRILSLKNRDFFFNLMKIEFCWRLIFETLSSKNLPCMEVM